MFLFKSDLALVLAAPCVGLEPSALSDCETAAAGAPSDDVDSPCASWALDERDGQGDRAQRSRSEQLGAAQPRVDEVASPRRELDRHDLTPSVISRIDTPNRGGLHLAVMPAGNGWAIRSAGQ